MAPPTLYFLRPSPPCRAVLLTAKMIGVEFKIQNVDLFGKKEHLTPEFLEMNPAHSVPTLDDNGFHLWESRAIMGYLVQQYAKDDTLYPKDPKKRATVDNMLYFDADSLYASIATYFYSYLILKQKPSQAQFDKIQEKIGILDAILKKTPYAAGDKLTIADISLLISITTLEGLEIDFKQHGNVHAWVSKLKKELPHYNEVVQPGLDDFHQFINATKAQIKE